MRINPDLIAAAQRWIEQPQAFCAWLWHQDDMTVSALEAESSLLTVPQVADQIATREQPYPQPYLFDLVRVLEFEYRRRRAIERHGLQFLDEPERSAEAVEREGLTMPSVWRAAVEPLTGQFVRPKLTADEEWLIRGLPTHLREAMRQQALEMEKESRRGFLRAARDRWSTFKKRSPLLKG